MDPMINKITSVTNVESSAFITQLAAHMDEINRTQSFKKNKNTTNNGSCITGSPNMIIHKGYILLQ
jgi:hypothetical protein